MAARAAQDLDEEYVRSHSYKGASATVAPRYPSLSLLPPLPNSIASVKADAFAMWFMSTSACFRWVRCGVGWIIGRQSGTILGLT